MITRDVAVRDLMSVDVITVQADDRISKVEEILELNPIHHVVVLERDKVAGIVSKLDLLKLLHRRHGSESLASVVRVRDIMTPNPLVVDPDDSVGLVADIILANHFHSLPVVEGDELQGIITSHDLLKFCYK